MRKQIFHHKDVSSTPKAPCTFLISISRATIQKHPETFDVYGHPPFHKILGPGRDIISWTITRREVYHLQLSDFQHADGHNYGLREKDSDSWVQLFSNMPAFRHHWRDFAPSIRTILAETPNRIRWKISEVPPLETWHSENGKGILLGDAAHGLPPYAGQGACAVIEDAAALAALVAIAPSRANIPRVARVYHGVWRARIEGFLEIIRENAKTFSLVDGEERRERDRRIGVVDSRGAEEIEDGKQRWQRTDKGEYGSAVRFRWIDDYDAVCEVSHLCLWGGRSLRWRRY